MSSVKHPKIKVRLTGSDGNAFAVIGNVQKALRSAGVPASEVAEFVKEASSGDYDNVLQTAMRWVDVR